VAGPFVFPDISSASSAEGSLPPGTLDFRRANQVDMRDPRAAQWNITLERDLGWSTGARFSYVGSTTKDLIWSPETSTRCPPTRPATTPSRTLVRFQTGT
jgi:hypothetical protein